MKPCWQQDGNKIYHGHVLEVLKGMASERERVHMVVTSPSYWGLRDYGLPPVIWDEGEYPVRDMKGNITTMSQSRKKCRHVWGESLP